MVESNAALLHCYQRVVRDTDSLSVKDLSGVLMGLYGEVGSVMATAKKLRREREVYSGYVDSCVEEFGDVLWYFCAICNRLEEKLEGVFGEEFSGSQLADDLVRQSDILFVSTSMPLLELGRAASNLFQLDASGIDCRKNLTQFARAYIAALDAAGLSLNKVIETNIRKVQGRFLTPDWEMLPTFDDGFPEDERLPDYFEIDIYERHGGKAHIRWNGVFVGDPLTDNIADSDGYRFHDVFHFANAAILHWSPTLRSLIKHKRKSNPMIDETEDGGRAIVVEEGLEAWIFSHAKESGFFARNNSLSFDLLKTVGQFVSGYEVQQCPLRLWEEAILQGYSVFRKVLKRGSGTIVGDRKKRTVVYRERGVTNVA